MNYLTLEEIKMEFANHLKKYRDYSPAEAAMAVSDFPDPYQNEYLFEDFVGPCVVNGKRYEQYATCTQLFRCGIDIPDFYFYTLYLEEDLKDHTVGEYKKAKKLYIVDEIDPSDFPTMENEEEFEYDLDFPVEI